MNDLIFRPLASLILALLLVAFTSCTESEPEPASQPEASIEEARPVVYVPVAPYEYVFEKIAGDLIDLRVIVGPGDDPHSYSPTPRQVADLSNANLITSGELGFEANYFVKLGDGTDGPLELHLLEGLDLLEGHCDHPSHQTETTEDDHDHSHDDLNDPHIWLSPSNLKLVSGRIATELKKLLPTDQAPLINANLAAFHEEMDVVHAELKQTLADHEGTSFYVYHGAFAYFARDYGLEQVAIESGNRTPTPQELANISKEAKDKGIELIFVQPQFDQTSARALAESTGAKLATLDPLEKDVIANLRAIANAVTSDG